MENIIIGLFVIFGILLFLSGVICVKSWKKQKDGQEGGLLNVLAAAGFVVGSIIGLAFGGMLMMFIDDRNIFEVSVFMGIVLVLGIIIDIYATSHISIFLYLGCVVSIGLGFAISFADKTSQWLPLFVLIPLFVTGILLGRKKYLNIVRILQ